MRLLDIFRHQAKQDLYPDDETLGMFDYRERPSGYRPVYVTVPPDVIPKIAQEGLLVASNRMKDKYPEVEKIFQETAAGYQVHGLDRTKCLFAFPYSPLEPHPKTKNVPYLVLGNDALLEVLVDPKKSWVADGQLYERVCRCVYRKFAGLDFANELASRYWKGLTLLANFEWETEGPKKMEAPEVLIPSDVSPQRVKILKRGSLT